MHKTKIRYLLTACAGGLIGLLSFMKVAHAETHIIDGHINDGEYWSASSSPYIIDTTVNVDSGETLTIGPGVSIIGSPLLEGYDAFYVQGSLFLNGQKDRRIGISGTGSINISGGTTTASYSDISLPNGLSVNRGYAYIYDSTVSNAYNGIWALSSKVDIKDSRLDNNQTAIYVQSPNGGVFQVNSSDRLLPDTGGVGNAFSDDRTLAMSTAMPSEVSVAGSSISGNAVAAIMNKDEKSVYAMNDWWGTDAGPSTVGENKISGLAEYAPWLSEDPFLTKKKPDCCSSILFIPGLESTRLYRSESWPILGIATNRLWEPNRNADVQKLFLDNDGSSTDPYIYSGGPIDKALGLTDIYGRFMGYLSSLSKSGAIKEWRAFGYDWRKPITEVVAGAEKKATTTESLIRTVAGMASLSKTGKVTLIAHSNGGLVAKYLVKVLADMGKESLIDSVISVAVPYLGTPQAIAGLLHGDSQSIAGGLILKDSIARSLGANMASAYSLLPSRQFFSKMFSPTIAFASTSMNGLNDGSYPKEISSFEEQSRFIGNADSGRLSASSSDVSLPIKGNQYLMAAADVIHGILDPFQWPISITRFAIIGWDQPTTKGLVYDNGISCRGLLKAVCNSAKHHTVATLMGDGTVVAPSAAYNAGTVAAMDLKALSYQENKNVDHANILGASSTRSAVDAIVMHNPADSSQEIIDKLRQIPGITIGEPDYDKAEPSFLVLSTHSPVELNAYDSKGRHTGIIQTPASTDEPIEEGLYTFAESDIPGSKFESVGGTENDPEYQIYLPDDGEKYSVVLNGTGVGEFTFNIDRIVGGSYAGKIEYAHMPVTPLTIATMNILTGKPASTSPMLSIDLDGNSSADVVTAPKTQFDPLIYLEAIKKPIISLAGDLRKGKDLIKRIDKIESLIKKGKTKQTDKAVFNLGKRVNHMKFKKLDDKDRQRMLDMIGSFIAQYE